MSTRPSSSQLACTYSIDGAQPITTVVPEGDGRAIDVRAPPPAAPAPAPWQPQPGPSPMQQTGSAPAEGLAILMASYGARHVRVTDVTHVIRGKVEKYGPPSCRVHGEGC